MTTRKPRSRSSTTNLYPDLLAAADESIQSSTTLLDTSRSRKTTTTRKSTRSTRSATASASATAGATAGASVTASAGASVTASATDNASASVISEDMMKDDGDGVRKPDPVQTSRLIESTNSFASFDDDHRLLQEAMEASRLEFEEHRMRLEAERTRRLEYRQQFAIVIARLSLWHRSSSATSQNDDTLFLNYILDQIRYATRSVEEEDMLLEPPPISSFLQQDYEIFINKLSESRLYKDVVEKILKKK